MVSSIEYFQLKIYMFDYFIVYSNEILKELQEKLVILSKMGENFIGSAPEWDQSWLMSVRGVMKTDFELSKVFF